METPAALYTGRQLIPVVACMPIDRAIGLGRKGGISWACTNRDKDEKGYKLGAV